LLNEFPLSFIIKVIMAEQARLIDIYIMGKHYRVPEGLTILTALEYSGYRMIRGCGCRAGFCGACATVYNFQNDPKLRFDLACQRRVEPEMSLVQIPFFSRLSKLRIIWKKSNRTARNSKSFIRILLNVSGVIPAPRPARRNWKRCGL
jgi:uncharacterized 2Fe-2S/4Fe-4S cluster protein (DUF4445 family)